MRTQHTGLRLLLATIFFALTAHMARAAQHGDFTYEVTGANITSPDTLADGNRNFFRLEKP